MVRKGWKCIFRTLKRFWLVIALFVNIGLRIHAGTLKELADKPKLSPGDQRAKSYAMQLPATFIMIEPYHGLGNRLRAYGSAAALAKKTGRHLVVVWIPDPHVNATMPDLFDTTNIEVIDYPVASSLSLVFPEILWYDYNSRGGKDVKLRNSAPLPIYVRSAYVLQSETPVSEADISEEILSLTPSREVFEHVHELEKVVANIQTDLVGVHVRMNTDILTDVPGIQNIEKGSPASASHMGPVISERARCHYKAFIPRMKNVLEKNPSAKFFIASDSSCAIISLTSKFPGKVFSTDLNKLLMCEGINARGKTCLQISLSEFMVLGGRVSYLIVSEWSSASELILRLGAHQVPHESGCKPKTRSIFAFLG